MRKGIEVRRRREEGCMEGGKGRRQRMEGGKMLGGKKEEAE